MTTTIDNQEIKRKEISYYRSYPLNYILHFTTSIRRLLEQRVQKALKQKQVQLVKRCTALE